jgi:hypothetical protein
MLVHVSNPVTEHSPAELFLLRNERRRMMRLNVFKPKPGQRTHEGARARIITPEQALRRSVLSCMLWEGEFYEDGV